MYKNIILFEGHDDSGKSNIATELSKQTNIPYFKCSLEHKMFKQVDCDFDQEHQLKYDTLKFIQLIQQNVINNVIVDRDYVSEYVYGKLFREEKYNTNNCDYYVKLYDRMYFLTNLLIILTHKPDLNDYKDELVNLTDAKRVYKRYITFLNFTINNVLMLDTTNKDLENQLYIILNYMNKLKHIYEYNCRVYLEKSQNDKIYFPGWFRGDKILFIGQNPGQPLENDQFSQKIHKSKFSDYDQFIIRHNLSYLKSKYYNFLLKFTTQLNILPVEFSFTNIVKFSTLNNRPLTKLEVDDSSNILIEQINIFKPDKIVTFGKPAHICLQNLNIEHEPYYHPARYYYSKTERIL